MDFRGALEDLADALAAAGVEASVDPADLDLPGVWVTLDRLTVPTFTGGGLVRARLLLIVPDQDHIRAVEALQDLYDATVAVVDPMSDVESTLATVQAGPDLPALTFTHDIPA